MIRPLPGGAASTSPTAAGKSLSSFGTVGENREMTKNKGLWKKIIDVITKVVQKGASVSMVSKFSAKFGFWAGAKFATVVAGVAAAPFSAGFSLLVSALGALLLVYDVYQIYDFFVALEKEMDEDEKNSVIIREESATAITPSSTATQVSNTGGAAASVPRTPTRNAGGAALTSTSPSSTSGDSSSLTEVASYGGYKNRQEFTNAMMPWAQKAAVELKVPAEAILAQWGLETGYGKAGAVQGQFNYGNIQGTYRPSEPGLDAGAPRNFIKYNSMDDFVNDYVKQLKNPRYGLGKENLASQQFFEKLKAGGYAEDRNYVASLMKNTSETLVAGTPGTTPNYTPSARGATALASAPNTGNALLDIFAGYTKLIEDSMKQGGGSTVVNAPVTNIAQNGGGGGSGSATPYNTDMMKYLLRPVT
jgi:flagellum-specific peptidoglycan hydrolase FlgJ